jgi:hypothetical protein
MVIWTTQIMETYSPQAVFGQVTPAILVNIEDLRFPVPPHVKSNFTQTERVSLGLAIPTP